MELKNIQPETLVAAVRQVHMKLSVKKSMEMLIDEARMELPVVDFTLRSIAGILQMPDGPIKKRVLKIAKRDLVILLALREIEKGSVRTSRKTRPKSTACLTAN